MKLTEVVKLVEEGLKEISHDKWEITERNNHINYEHDGVEVSIQCFEYEWNTEINVCIEFKFNDLSFDIWAFGATFDKLYNLFEQYKFIKGIR